MAAPESHRNWLQGDASLDVRALPYVDREDEVVDIAVEGVVVLTQTCDILNAENGLEVPAMIQVAGLVLVSEIFVEEVRRYRMPRYMHVPAVAHLNLVADLNLCATFDRAVLERWTRLPALTDTEGRRRTGFVLGRHRSRNAFPDRWSPAFGKVKDWIRSKGGKSSDEGAFVNAIEEMRIAAEDVDAPAEAIVYIIVSKATPQAIRSKWTTEMLPKLRAKVDRSWGCEVTFVIQTLAEMTAEDHVNSSLMDFDALTRAANDDKMETRPVSAPNLNKDMIC